MKYAVNISDFDYQVTANLYDENWTYIGNARYLLTEVKEHAEKIESFLKLKQEIEEILSYYKKDE